MFQDKFLDKIWFWTKPGIFPDIMENFIYSGKVFGNKHFPKYFSDKNFRKKYFSEQNLDYFQILSKIFIKSDKVSGQNLFPDKILE